MGDKLGSHARIAEAHVRLASADIAERVASGTGDIKPSEDFCNHRYHSRISWVGPLYKKKTAAGHAGRAVEIARAQFWDETRI